MATVVDFPSHRARSAARSSASTQSSKQARIAPRPEPQPQPRKPLTALRANPRNLYDAALKGHMARRAGDLIMELQRAQWALEDPRSYRPSGVKPEVCIGRVIDEIKAIEAEVLRTTPEHHRPVEAETPTHAAVTNGEAVWWPR